jgi:hypothetical protein
MGSQTSSSRILSESDRLSETFPLRGRISFGFHTISQTDAAANRRSHGDVTLAAPGGSNLTGFLIGSLRGAL